MTKWVSDGYTVKASDDGFLIYICEPNREPFMHVLPGRVVEPWHMTTLRGTTSVLWFPAVDQ